MPLSYETLPGDVDHLVADDHAVVLRQFEHLEAGRGDRRVLVDQVSFQLALHATAEEEVVYPELAHSGDEVLSDHARHEHQDMKDQLAVLARTDPGEDAFEAALSRLILDVRTHVVEEEGQLLPQLRSHVGAARMAELGEQFLAAKRTAPTYAHPAAPSSGTGHTLADVGAAAVDKVRDKVSGRQQGLATDPSGLLDPQAQRILDAFSALQPLPYEILTPEQARRQPTLVDAIATLLEQDGAGQEPVGAVEDRTIPGPGGDLAIRVYTPAGATGPLPVVVWVHGGGWVLFTVDTYDASCRGLADKAGAVVVSPDYRRAPEHVFPAAHDDVLATYRWVAEHAAELGGDPARIAIGGESVGGTMAAATVLQLQQAGERLPVAQVLVYPLVTTEQIGDSVQDAADARPLTLPLLSWMAMHAFAGVPEGARDPRVDLLSLPAEQLAGFPPTLVITAERDVLRSSGEEFVQHLEAAGVPTTGTRYEHVMHEFFGAAAVLDAAEQAQQQAADHLTRAFQAAA